MFYYFKSFENKTPSGTFVYSFINRNTVSEFVSVMIFSEMDPLSLRKHSIDGGGGGG